MSLIKWEDADDGYAARVSYLTYYASDPDSRGMTTVEVSVSGDPRRNFVGYVSGLSDARVKCETHIKSCGLWESISKAQRHTDDQLKILPCGDTWSIQYDPSENDRPKAWFHHGSYHSPFKGDNATIDLFYSILEARAEIEALGGKGMIKRIKPQQPTTPQCDQEMGDEQFNTAYRERRWNKAQELGWERGRCLCHSSFEIRGKNYCGKHAGAIALDILLTDGDPKNAKRQR